MREIKFRAKRVGNGEWVEGYYFKTPLTDESTNSKPEDGWSFLSGRERHCISRNGCVYEVDAETVGEFTDVTDKNDNPVWEGDVLAWRGNGYKKNNRLSKVTFSYGAFMVEGVTWSAYWELGEMVSSYEVIGNVYDNKDLLIG